MTEKRKKPFYKRWWVLLIGAMIIFYIIGVTVENSESKKLEEKRQAAQQERELKKKEKEREKQEEEKKKQEKEKKTEENLAEKTIELNEELVFLNFKLKIKSVKIREIDGSYFIDLNMDWLNQSFPDKTTFLRAASIDVHQNNDILTETSGAWQNRNSDVYFPNAVRGWTRLNLQYELVDNKSPVKIVFVPHDEYDENQEVTINLD